MRRWIPAWLPFLGVVFIYAGGIYADEASLTPEGGKPTLMMSFSTYFGGPKGFGDLREVALDSLGNIILVGPGSQYNRENFPTARVLGPARDQNVVVAKFRPNGEILWVTIIGGSGADRGYGLAIDSMNDVYIAGQTASSDFPTTPSAWDHMNHGGLDAFVLKLSSDGLRLNYSTYLGGSGDDGARGGLAVDGRGFAYVVGFTSSEDFLDKAGVKNPAKVNTYLRRSPGGLWRWLQRSSASHDGFVAKVSQDGSSIVYSRYLIGMPIAVQVNSHEQAYLHAIVRSADAFTTADAYDRGFRGGEADSYFAKLSPDGRQVTYATYLGGNRDEWAEHGMAIDAEGNTFLVGFTNSSNFPTVNAYQPRPGGRADGYLVKVNPAGQPVFSTYLGGSGDDVAFGVAVDSGGRIFVVGDTSSTDFETTPDAYSRAYRGGPTDAFLRMYDRTGRLMYSSFLGGTGSERARHVVVDGSGSPILVGATDSVDFPTTPGAYQRSRSGDRDGFLVRFMLRETGTTQK